MSKLRLCSLRFKTGRNLVVLELGYGEYKGEQALYCIASKDIVNIKKVKYEIDDLEKMDLNDRAEWFSKNFPAAKIIKFQADKVFDRIKDNKDKESSASIFVDSAVELKWSK